MIKMVETIAIRLDMPAIREREQEEEEEEDKLFECIGHSTLAIFTIVRFTIV